MATQRIILGKDQLSGLSLRLTSAPSKNPAYHNFKLRNADQKNITIQFGTGPKFVPDQCMPSSLIQFKNKFTSKEERALVMRLQNQEKTIQDLSSVVNMVGEKLYKGMDLYFEGAPDMSLEDFMARGPRLVTTSTLTNQPEMFLNIGQYSSLYDVTFHEDSNTLSRTEAVVDAAKKNYHSMVCCSLSVSTTMKDGFPKWSINIVVNQAYLMADESTDDSMSGPYSSIVLGDDIEIVDIPEPPKLVRTHAMESDKPLFTEGRKRARNE